MSSLMMPRAGAGAVTVEGLTPEVLLAGHTVTVKRGNTVVESVEGELRVLAMYGGNWDAGVPSPFVCWDGSQYKTFPTKPPNASFAGEPKLLLYYIAGGTLSIGGRTYSNTGAVTLLTDFSEWTNKNISLSQAAVFCLLGV